MLIDDIVDFCDKDFTSYKGVCGKRKCNHPSGKCSGNCRTCLFQIHQPGRAKETTDGPIKEKYDCPKMLDQYICQFSHIYASEILYALNEEKDFLNDFPYFHIMSIGCGGCPDLMAFEKFVNDNNQCKQRISYVGYDDNPLWEPIQKEIKKYCDENSNMSAQYRGDIFNYLQKYSLLKANVIVISYFLSYLYNSDKISEINMLSDQLIKNVVLKKEKGQNLLFIINDVNSCYRGRDHFDDFIKSMEKYHVNILQKKYMYFDTGYLHDGQKIGSAYSSTCSLFDIPVSIRDNYQANTQCRQTIQLLVEVK